MRRPVALAAGIILISAAGIAAFLLNGVMFRKQAAVSPAVQVDSKRQGPDAAPAAVETERDIFKHVKTAQVTPDSNYLTGSFARIHHVPANDNFVVTFGSKTDCEGGAGIAYKEYDKDIKETGKHGRIIWSDKACEAGDTGSTMVGNDYYLAVMAGGYAPGKNGWQVYKFDATDWKKLAETNIPLNLPYEVDNDMDVAYLDGEIDVSGQYNPEGHPPDGFGTGASSHHHFLSTDLKPLGTKRLDDSSNICGASMIHVDGYYYLVTADGFIGDIVVIKYDKDWKHVGTKKLVKDAHWSQGLVYDGGRFYVSYLDTSDRNAPEIFPIVLNVHLAAFDGDWNLIDDVAVTKFTRADRKLAGRPSVILNDGRLYVSYDVDTRDPVTDKEDGKWQAFVDVYELTGD